MIGLFSGVVAAFGGMLLLEQEIRIGLIVWIISGILGGLGIGLIFGLIEIIPLCLQRQVIGTNQRPNEGIMRSLYSAVVICIVGGLSCGVIIWLIFGLTLGVGGGILFGLEIGLRLVLLGGGFFGLLIGLIGGLSLGISYGGRSVIQHYTLRLLLARVGHAPLHYAAFLDHAAERVLLRRVGGGWVFVHRMLLEHFAGRYREQDEGKSTGDL